MRCTRVEPVIRGFNWVKFEDERDRQKLWHKCYEQCSGESVVIKDQGNGIVFHHCYKHNNEKEKDNGSQHRHEKEADQEEHKNGSNPVQ